MMKSLKTGQRCSEKSLAELIVENINTSDKPKTTRVFFFFR